jgi:threonine dehydrogenase-like Zn-dependent dehydrogenase
MVTAEAALVLPMVAAFCLVMVWLLSVGVAQVRVVDAARDAARAIARGEDQDAAATAARRTAPAGADVAFDASAEAVTVRVSVQATAPGWLLVPLPAIAVGSSATVEAERDVDAHP